MAERAGLWRGASLPRRWLCGPGLRTLRPSPPEWGELACLPGPWRARAGRKFPDLRVGVLGPLVPTSPVGMACRTWAPGSVLRTSTWEPASHAYLWVASSPGIATLAQGPRFADRQRACCGGLSVADSPSQAHPLPMLVTGRRPDFWSAAPQRASGRAGGLGPHCSL